MKHLINTILLSSVFFLLAGNVLAEEPYRVTQGYEGVYDISKGKGVIVAVIDTGVWRDHPDFGQAMWVNPKEIPANKIDDDKNGYIDDYTGWNFVDNSSNLNPKSAHGTNVAGIIIAQPDNNIGVAGIAPDAKIMPLIACDAKDCPKQAVLDAIKYAVDNKAKVINLSLGPNGYLTYSADYDKMVKYAYDRGVVVVASVGNGDVKSTKQVGKDTDKTKVSPIWNETAEVNRVIGVGSTGKSSFVKTNWSNYGYNYIDVWVRGDSLITTTMPVFAKKKEYETVSGTSFSAPIISASAAVLMSKYPNLKVYQVISMIKYTNPFNLRTLLTNTVYNSQCRIDYATTEIKNGTSFSLKASNLKPGIVLTLRNSDTNASVSIPTKNIAVINYDKLKVDISKLSIPAGTYWLQSDTCSAEGKIVIKGDPKVAEVKKACTIKDIGSCNKAELLDLIKGLLKK
jgi:subtilisin family serine protease